MLPYVLLMATLFRGAGPGNYWHTQDARVTGFSPHFAGATPSVTGIMNHIARGSSNSPYISFTKSFGVARTYGVVGPGGFATLSVPGFVYEIEVADDSLCRPLDPVVKIAERLGDPWVSSYHHDGEMTFILGVADPISMAGYLRQTCSFPPGTAATPRPANLSKELETLVRALRDSEILIHGNVPASLVRNRYNVY